MNHGAKEPTEPEFQMDLPDPDLYRDVNSDSDVPSLSMQLIKSYYKLFEKEFEEKYVTLYEERYVRFIRMACRDSTTYFSASVSAEMRKTVSYRLDISIQDGSLCEAQCECGAGQGPNAHCKHVAAVLYGLSKFDSTKSLTTELTCTEKLQTFHRVASNKGSPVKMGSLKRKADTLFTDPRLPKYQQTVGYKDFFKNAVVNFCDVGRSPMQQLCGVSNLEGLKEHSYANVDNREDTFLKSRKILKISDEECQEVEASTREQSTSKRWKQERQCRLTSSKFDNICRAVVKDNKAEACKKLSLTLLTTPPPTSSSLNHGLKFEASAIRAFEKSSEKKVTKCGLVIKPSHPFLGASPDGLVGEDCVIEVKSPYIARNQAICHKSVPYLQLQANEKLTLKKAHTYYYQIQGQLFCTGRRLCYFCVYTSKDFLIVEIPRDESFIDQMVGKLTLFFHDFFKKKLVEKCVYKR